MGLMSGLPPIAQMIAAARAPQRMGPAQRQIVRAPSQNYDAVMAQWKSPEFLAQSRGKRATMRDRGAASMVGYGQPRGNWSDAPEHHALMGQMESQARKAAMQLIAIQLRQVARGTPASQLQMFGGKPGRRDRGLTGANDRYRTLQNRAWEAEGAYAARTNGQYGSERPGAQSDGTWRRYPTPQG